MFFRALTLGTFGATVRAATGSFRFYSLNFGKLGVLESSLMTLFRTRIMTGQTILKGLCTFEKRGYKIPGGCDIAIEAIFRPVPGFPHISLEVLTGIMLRDTFGFTRDNESGSALIGQYSENNFNGMNCGIMDQFVSAMGKRITQFSLIQRR